MSSAPSIDGTGRKPTTLLLQSFEDGLWSAQAGARSSRTARGPWLGRRARAHRGRSAHGHRGARSAPAGSSALSGTAEHRPEGGRGSGHVRPSGPRPPLLERRTGGSRYPAAARSASPLARQRPTPGLRRRRRLCSTTSAPERPASRRRVAACPVHRSPRPTAVRVRARAVDRDAAARGVRRGPRSARRRPGSTGSANSSTTSCSSTASGRRAPARRAPAMLARERRCRPATRSTASRSARASPAEPAAPTRS